MSDEYRASRIHGLLFCLALIAIVVIFGYFIRARYQLLDDMDSYVKNKKQDFEMVAGIAGCFRKSSIFMPFPVEKCIDVVVAGRSDLYRFRAEAAYSRASGKL